MKAVIANVHARQILDSRGNPTVETEVSSSTGKRASFCVPSGASTGTREALEIRDGDPKVYMGKGVQRVVDNINKIIAKALEGKEFDDQKEIDSILIKLDGTENKSKLGANGILSVSVAVARLRSYEKGTSLHEEFGPGSTLPVPMMNVINGGAHADNNLDFQEFMIVPFGFGTFSEALRAGVEVYHTLKSVLKKAGKSTGVGDEGGFAPNIESHDAAIDYLLTSIEKAGYHAGSQIGLALDCASSEFFDGKNYNLEKSGGGKKTPEEMVKYYEHLVERYPIMSIEDGCAEQDSKGWKLLTKELGKKVMLVGDDNFVTNEKIFKKGIEEGIANAILIKLNQVGTVTETLQTIALARKNKYKYVISHRSGETEDSAIADLAVATDALFIKTGAPCRTDRTAKYNQLLRIEESLGRKGRYAGNLILK